MRVGENINNPKYLPGLSLNFIFNIKTKKNQKSNNMSLQNNFHKINIILLQDHSN